MKGFATALLSTLLSASLATAMPLTVGWDAGPNWPVGTTVEACVNEVCAAGITATSATLDVSFVPGDRITARARAIPPIGYQCGDPLALCPPSDYATLAAIYPAPLTQVVAHKVLVGTPSMTAPTFVAQYATAFNSATTPKTAMNAVAINSNDVIVAMGIKENEYDTLGMTENGSASLVSQQTIDSIGYCEIMASTYTATGNENLTITVVLDVESYWFGGNAIRFSGSDGVGASNKSNGASGSPSVSITTTQANSAIVVIVGDWNAVSGTQTFTSNGGAGSATALTGFPGDNSHYGVAISYYADAGTVGAKTVGMSAPTGQKWTIIAVEVKGSGGAAPTALPRRVLDGPLVGAFRGSVR